MSSTALSKPTSVSTTLASRSPATPATPPSQKQSLRSPTVHVQNSTPQPGTWHHPSLDEIARRQNASVFNGDNINRVLLNGAILVASLYLPELAHSYTPAAVQTLLASFHPYTNYAVLACRLLLVFNIIIACRPLFRTKDDIEDIPLTPSQRALLGLKPSSTPLTPGQQYITPPRYARSSTPRSSASAQRLADASPAASPSFDRSTMAQSKGSPYSHSPLMQKALGGASTARRLSYTSSSPLETAAMPATSSTALGNGKASVGLNSKWLYERGRASPSGKGLFT